MIDVERILEHAEQQCQRKGVRLTEKRKWVLSTLLASEKALSAYEIAAQIDAQQDKSIPPMSVYRILAFLEQEKLAHKLELTNKFVGCSHIACAHEHKTSQFLICSRCQKVKEIMISASVMATFKESIEGAGFQFVCSQLEMNSICNECAYSGFNK